MVGCLPETAKLEWAPETFKSFGRIARTRNDELCKAIVARLRLTFHDVRGMNLVHTGGNNFMVELFFEKNTEPMPEGKITNLINLVEPMPATSMGGNNLLARKRIVNNRIDGKTFTLNDETKLLLSDFMFGGREHNKPNSGNWNKNISEIHIPNYEPMVFGSRRAERVLVVVRGLDIRKLIQLLYGRTMVTHTVEQGNNTVNYTSNANYELRFIKFNTDATFTLNIEEITVKENPVVAYNTGGVSFFS